MLVVITPGVEVLLLDRARLVGVDGVPSTIIVTWGTCGRDDRQSVSRGTRR